MSGDGRRGSSSTSANAACGTTSPRRPPRRAGCGPTPPGGGQPRVLKIEAFLLAQRFHGLPEPERSALALFYLDFFTVAEIAELLKMTLETLAETLGAARGLLAQSLQPAAE